MLKTNPHTDGEQTNSLLTVLKAGAEIGESLRFLLFFALVLQQTNGVHSCTVHFSVILVFEFAVITPTGNNV